MVHSEFELMGNTLIFRDDHYIDGHLRERKLQGVE